MAKDPAFLFYPNDYLGGTLGMTFEQKGAYIEVLMMQFNLGHLSESKILNMLHSSVDLWDNIKPKFDVDSTGLFYNKRLEVEQERRSNYTESRRNNKDGKNQYSSKEGHTVGHMTSHMDGHMEDENRDRIKDVIKDKSKEVDFTKLAEYYNQKLCPPLAKVTIPLSESRKTAIRMRAKEHSKEAVFKMLNDVLKSDFLLGENDKSWKANFDWIFNSKNFLKVIEGNYLKQKKNETTTAAPYHRPIKFTEG